MSDTPYTPRHASHSARPVSTSGEEQPVGTDATQAPVPVYDIPSGSTPEVYGVHKQTGGGHGHGHGSGHHGHGHHHRRRHVGRVVLVVVLALVALAGLEGFVLYGSVRRVQGYASSLSGALSTAGSSLSSGDAQALREASTSANVGAHGIKSELDGPAWTVASAFPVVGQDVRSVRTLADVLVDLSDNALSPIAAKADGLNLSGMVDDGAINVDALQQLASVVGQAQPVVDRAAKEMDALPTSYAIPQVGAAVEKARTTLDGAAALVDSSNRLLPYLPDMLGAGGQTRNYLVVAQNNSELRSTGGFAGSWSNLAVTNGRMELGDSLVLQHAYKGDLGWTEEERAAFWLASPTDPSGVSIIPDFSVAGSRMAEAYYRNTDIQPDGVIAVDPVFLQGLLGLVGGVTTSDGTTVDGTNAAQALLSDVYWRYGTKSDVQDAFFAEVAQLTFQKLVGGLGDLKLSDLSALAKESVESRRLQVWMRDDAQEAALDEMGSTGRLSQDRQHPTLGVYLTDNTWAKIDWYLRMDTQVGQATKNADGSATYHVTTTLGNTSSDEVLADAPLYVYGNCPEKRDKTDIVLFPILVAPAGGSIANVTVSNGYALSEYTCYGLDMWTGYANVSASEGTVEITYDVTTAPEGGQAELAVAHTALAQE